jgi:protein-tyrosine phosphatase
MPALLRWSAGLGIAVLLTVVPFVYYRYEYSYSKRLREVVPQRVYRSGQMTAPGFADAVEKLKIQTIINLQDEYPDPDIALGYFTKGTVKESELCRRLEVVYLYLPPDLIARRLVGVHRPRAIDRFLEIMDDPHNYPVLIHCKAGLHRTGIMTAVYRMEYQGWSPHQAIEEMKQHGFAEWPCTAANDYITQYLLTYQPGIRNHTIAGRPVEPALVNRPKNKE